jgi:hypothetical protein
MKFMTIKNVQRFDQKSRTISYHMVNLFKFTVIAQLKWKKIYRKLPNMITKTFHW